MEFSANATRTHSTQFEAEVLAAIQGQAMAQRMMFGDKFVESTLPQAESKLSLESFSLATVPPSEAGAILSTSVCEEPESPISSLGLILKASGQTANARCVRAKALSTSDEFEEDDCTASGPTQTDGSGSVTGGSEQASDDLQEPTWQDLGPPGNWAGYAHRFGSAVHLDAAVWSQDFATLLNQQTCWKSPPGSFYKPQTTLTSGLNVDAKEYTPVSMCSTKAPSFEEPSSPDSVVIADGLFEAFEAEEANIPLKVLDSNCGKGLKPRKLPRGQPVKKQPLDLD